MNTKRDNTTKEELKSKLEEYLISKGIDVNHNFTCLNPSHSDSTPSMSYYKDSNTVYCHGCGVTYDIFSLFAIDHLNATINTDGQPNYNFKKAYNDIADMYHMDVNKLRIKPEDALNQQINRINEIVVTNAKKNLEKGSEYLKKRGISLDLAKKYGLGFIEKWVNPTISLKENRELQPTPRLIIPTSNNSYLARDTRENIPDNEKKYQKQKQGKNQLFNIQALQDTSKPLFVVEGELDALSVMQVTTKANAIALGSTSNINLLRNAIIRIKQNKTPNNPYFLTILLALDNDNAGQLASRKLNAMLNSIDGIEVHTVNIAKDFKDENEALVKAYDKFKNAVNERIKDPDNYLLQFLEDSQHLFEHPNITPTGFKNLDEALGGGLSPQLYVLGAISSLGKSTLALQIADKLAQQNVPVLFFALEMTKRDLTSKLLSRITSDIANSDSKLEGLSSQELNSGKWLANENSRAVTNKALQYLQSYFNYLHIYDAAIKRPTVKDIYSKVDAFTTQHPDQHPLIVVDYLQILKAVNERATDKAQVTESIATLKEIASKFEVPVLVVSSLNRMSYEQSISMSAFKESGEIEYYADVLLGMQFSIVTDNEKVTSADIAKEKQRFNYDIDVIVLKNRSGKTGEAISFRFTPQFNIFVERVKTLLDRAKAGGLEHLKKIN